MHIYLTNKDAERSINRCDGPRGYRTSLEGKDQHGHFGIEELELGALAGERFGVPVHVENDVNAAAAGAVRILCLPGRRLIAASAIC